MVLFGTESQDSSQASYADAEHIEVVCLPSAVTYSCDAGLTVHEPEKHCVFAMWKHVSSGGYGLTFVRVPVMRMISTSPKHLSVWFF